MKVLTSFRFKYLFIIAIAIAGFGALFFPTSKTHASSVYTVATSTISSAETDYLSTAPQRTLWESSDGNLITFYQSGGSLYYTTSTTGGSSWSNGVQIVHVNSSWYYFSAYMDGSNNIYLTYTPNVGVSSEVYEVELTYGGSGSWTLGTSNVVNSGPGTDLTYPNILVDSSGTIWVAYNDLETGSSTYAVSVNTSTNAGASWSAPTQVSATSSSEFFPSLSLYNNHYPLVVYGNATAVYAQTYNGSTWSGATEIDNTTSLDGNFSTVSIGNNVLYVGDRSAFGNLAYSIFNAASSTWSARTVISTSTADTYDPKVVTDGTNAWVLYSHYNGTTSDYDIYERKYNGVSLAWDTTGTALTATGNNNLFPQLPSTILSAGTIPYVYTSGTSSPYTVNYSTYSTLISAPIISAVSSTPSVTTSTITWTTNVPSDSLVNYGTSTTYTNSSTYSSSYVTSHSITLSGLASSTVYHYQVVSSDGVVATSSDQTFTTAVATTPIISSVSSTPSITTAAITWTTNVAAVSYVNYGTSTTYTASSSVTGSTTTPSISLSGLIASTTYHFQAVSSDGVVVTSTDQTFTTLPTVAPPIISNVSSTAGVTTSTISWNTNVSTISYVNYGTSTTYTASSSVVGPNLTPSVTLSGLLASTTYHFQAVSSNGVISTSSDQTFTTAPPPAAPAISGISSGSPTVSGATITWTTNVGADSLVNYGTSTTYTNSSTYNGTYVTSHSVTLSGLLASTTYHFQAVSNDGNVTTSSDQTFTTAAALSSYSVVTSSNAYADASILEAPQRSLWQTSDNDQILFYQSGGFLYYTTSTTGGSSWSNGVQIAHTSSANYYFSSYMDGSNNIYLVYAPSLSSEIYEVELTYDGAGSWTLGSANTVNAAPGTATTYPSILVDPSGTIWVAYNDLVSAGADAIEVNTSTNSGASWSSPTQVSATSSSNISPSLSLYNNQYPLVVYGNASAVYSQIYNGSSWSGLTELDNSTNVAGNFSTVSIGNNVLYVGARPTFGTLGYAVFNAASSTWSARTVISTSSADTYDPSVVTDGTNAWVLYSHFNSTSSYDIYERKYSGASLAWDTTGTALTNTGNNNLFAQAPTTISPAATIAYAYMSGTSNPYTINYSTYSTFVSPAAISAISSNPGVTTSTITWTTNVGADSLVNYGTSTTYTASSTYINTFVTSHSISLAGLVASTTYHYQIVSSDGNVATSTDKTFTTLPPPPSPVISNVSTSFTGGTTVITWTTDEGSDSLVNYGTSTTYTNSSTYNGTYVTSHSVTLSGLTASTTYHFQIVSVDNGSVATSSDMTLTVPGAPALSAITVAQTTANGALITWTTDTPSDSLVNYGTSTTYTASSTYNGIYFTSHSMPLSGLSPSTVYHYQVVSSNGGVATSTDMTFTTTNGSSDPPGEPVNVTTTQVSDTEINLTWDRVGNNDTSVTVLRSASGSPYTVLTTLPAGSNIYTDTSCYPSTTYSYEITDNNANGSSIPSVPVSGTTETSLATSTPASNFAATATSPYSITITFTDNQPTSTVRTYYIERSTGGAFQMIEILSGVNATDTYTDNYLTPSTTYYYRTRAILSQGYTAYTPIASATTPAAGAGTPNEPTNLLATINNATSTTLTWTDTNSGTASYIIQTAPVSFTDGTYVFSTIATTTVGASSYNFTTTAENFYYVRVIAQNTNGQSGPTNFIDIRTPSPGTGSPKVYTIGPGEEYTSLGALNWEALGPGDTVEIFPNRDEDGNIIPYYEKPLISVRGTAQEPINIIGIPDPTTGQLPIIDGTNAVTSPQWESAQIELSDLSLVLFGETAAQGDENGYTPGYINFENLQIQNAYTDTNNAGSNATTSESYIAYNGTTRQYLNSQEDAPSGIYFQNGDHITIKGCIITGDSNGVFGAGMGDWRNLEDITLDSNYLYNDGDVGNDQFHQSYLEGVNTLYQFNTYGQALAGSTGGAGPKDRGAGTILRYNFITGSGHLLDLVETENYYKTILPLASYNSTYVYGNVFDNTLPAAATTMFDYGGDQGITPDSRKGVMYFYDNTVVNYMDSSNLSYSGPFDMETNAESVDAWNNIIDYAPISTLTPSIDYLLINGVGQGYFGTNWLSQGWQTSKFNNENPAGTLHLAGTSNFINNGSTNNPGFISISTPDLALSSGSDNINAAAALPLSFPAVQYEYGSTSSPEMFRSGVADNGAYGYSTDTSPPSVSITNLSSGATVSSTVTVSALATDNVSVAGVEFAVDGVDLGTYEYSTSSLNTFVTATSGPNTYSISFNSALFSNGSHTLTATAYDGANNTSTDSIPITIANNTGSSTPTIAYFTASPASVTSAGTSTLSWNVSNASSVAITPGTFSTSTLLGSITVNPTSTTTYTLTATNINGTNTDTAIVTVSASTSTTSTAPQSLAATSGNTSISLSWLAPSSNGGSALTQYLVYDRLTGSSTFALYATTTPSTTTSTVTSLTNGQSYDFEVVAQNSVGTSSPSGIVSATPYTIPSPPTGAAASAGNAEATISFTPGSNGGSTILYYTATSNPGNISATSTVSPIVVTNLTNGTPYTFVVTATNAAGTSASSSASASITPSGSDPVVSVFTALPLDVMPGVSSTLSWITVNASSVAINQGIGSQATTGSVVVHPTSTTVYTLTATNGSGSSTAEATITVDGTAPSVPTGLAANAVSTTEIDLSWAASTDNVGVAGYGIYQNGNFLTTTTNTFYANTGLSASTQYMYFVDAFDSAGNVSATSTSVSATTQSAPSSGGGGGGGGGVYIPPVTTTSTTSTSTPITTTTTSTVGLTIPQEESLLASLEAELQALELQVAGNVGGQPISSSVFTRNLTIGMTGSDVKSLQQFLVNENAGPSARILSAHGTTEYFGALTQAALAEYQHYAGITPASGYFGPITRAEIANPPAPAQTTTGQTPTTPVVITAPTTTTVTVPPSVTTPSTPSSPTLSLGSTGLDVTTLQIILMQEDYLPQGVFTQGTFDAATLRAVETFQCIEGIACSSATPGYGVVGPKTAAALGF